MWREGPNTLFSSLFRQFNFYQNVVWGLWCLVLWWLRRLGRYLTQYCPHRLCIATQNAFRARINGTFVQDFVWMVVDDLKYDRINGTFGQLRKVYWLVDKVKLLIQWEIELSCSCYSFISFFSFWRKCVYKFTLSKVDEMNCNVKIKVYG